MSGAESKEEAKINSVAAKLTPRDFSRVSCAKLIFLACSHKKTRTHTHSLRKCNDRLGSEIISASTQNCGAAGEIGAATLKKQIRITSAGDNYVAKVNSSPMKSGHVPVYFRMCAATTQSERCREGGKGDGRKRVNYRHFASRMHTPSCALRNRFS